MVYLKSPREISLMREAGKLVAEALRICRDMARPGTKTIDIDRAVEDFYAHHKAVPLFKGYKGGANAPVPFPAVTCISLNEQVVHGIPGQRVIKEGDLVKFDTACQLDGWCADAAITVAVGTCTPERLRLLDVTRTALERALGELPSCGHWLSAASRIQGVIEAAGFRCAAGLAGHGIGKELHEPPLAPNSTEEEFEDFPLEVGLVLAIEPMAVMGSGECFTDRDRWTVRTRDGLPAAHFEHTVAITAQGVEVLTI